MPQPHGPDFEDTDARLLFAIHRSLASRSFYSAQVPVVEQGYALPGLDDYELVKTWWNAGSQAVVFELAKRAHERIVTSFDIVGVAAVHHDATKTAQLVEWLRRELPEWVRVFGYTGDKDGESALLAFRRFVREPDKSHSPGAESPSLTLHIDPGDAPAEVIAGVFRALSDLHAAAGGSGLRFEASDESIMATAVAEV